VFGRVALPRQAAGPGCADVRSAVHCAVAVAAFALLISVGPAEARVSVRHGQAAKAVPEALPPGPLSIIVSIPDQRLTLFGGSTPIATSRVSTGTPGHSTPSGVFSVIQKKRWHRSNLYSAAPMPFMQRITWSGIALHAGVVPGYPASHGCIRLPPAFAQRLWHLTRIGARVIIARRPVAPFAITHPRLFAARPAEPPAPRRDAPATGAAVRTAEAASMGVASDLRVQAPRPDASLPDVAQLRPSIMPGNPAAVTAEPPMPVRKTPVSVFISRKEGRLFVRSGFEPLFDAPVTIRDPDQPLGTHVFTATDAGAEAGSLRWTAITMPGEPPVAPRSAKVQRRPDGAARPPAAAPQELPPPSTAAEALDRIDLPQEALDRISAMITPGASLIVSDQGRGPETGIGTSFIVLTR
jgi:hypothetical protein